MTWSNTRLLFTFIVSIMVGPSFNYVGAQDFDIFGDAPAASVPSKPNLELPSADSSSEQKPAAPEVLKSSPDKVTAAPGGSRNSANAAAPALNSLYSNQWLSTDENGILRGSVVALAGQDTIPVVGARVTLTQRGRVAMTVMSSPAGEFMFMSVPSGFYSIVADADNSFATLGIAVTSHELGKNLPNSIELRVIRPRRPGVDELLQRDLVPSISETRPDLILRDPLPTRIASSTHRIAASKDGTVSGYISKMGVSPDQLDMGRMRAYLLKDGKIIETVGVRKNGLFEFSAVPSGCYGLLTTGPNGVAAVAFCVVDNNTVVKNKSINGERFVSLNESAALTSLNVELADVADVNSAQTPPPPPPAPETEPLPPEEEEVTALPMASPGFGGYPPGSGQVINGGGAGSGLSNLGPVLSNLGAAGLLAWGLSEINSNDNNDVVSPIVAR